MSSAIQSGLSENLRSLSSKTLAVAAVARTQASFIFLFLSFLIETLDKFPDLGLLFIPKVGDLLRSYARGRQTDSAGGTFGGIQNTQLLYDVADADHAISFVK